MKQKISIGAAIFAHVRFHNPIIGTMISTLSIWFTHDAERCITDKHVFFARKRFLAIKENIPNYQRYVQFRIAPWINSTWAHSLRINRTIHWTNHYRMSMKAINYTIELRTYDEILGKKHSANLKTMQTNDCTEKKLRRPLKIKDMRTRRDIRIRGRTIMWCFQGIRTSESRKVLCRQKSRPQEKNKSSFSVLVLVMYFAFSSPKMRRDRRFGIGKPRFQLKQYTW